MNPTASTDAELVQGSLAGDRDAFGRIVTRYQALICSLAYSSTGDLGKSEDLAQETFVTAWKQLKGLRDPAKLKSWLCGIVRNLTSGARRRDGREPSHRAEELNAASEPVALEPLPMDQAISQEEASLLWRSLEQIPETYREPLILFYRQHQSVEEVAVSLELSEDAVKQRLSRGRKLLHEQVLAMVEGTLARTAPDAAFTANVMGALPVATAGAGIGTLTGASAKGWIAVVSVLAGPAVGFLSAFMGYKLEMQAARSDGERSLIRRFSYAMWVFVFGVVAFQLVLVLAGGFIFRGHYAAIPWAIGGLGAAYLAACWALFRWESGERRRLIAAGAVPEGDPADPGLTHEYRSRAEFLGIPLLHVVWTRRIGSNRRPAFGWFAAGNRAYGLLAAFGNVAVAPLSFGGISIGLMAWGCCSLGPYAIGAVGLGYFAMGGFVVGWHAYGSMALGWQTATGGWAASHSFATGGVYYAPKLAPAVWHSLRDQAEQFRNFGVLSLRWLSAIWICAMLAYWQLVTWLRRRRAAA